MTRMTKAKRAQRKEAKDKVKIKAKAKAKKNAETKENGKAKAKKNGTQLKMRMRYSMKRSAPISAPKTSRKQPSTQMQKKQARLSDQFCKLEQQKKRFISSCYDENVEHLIKTGANNSVECEQKLIKFSNGYSNAIYIIFPLLNQEMNLQKRHINSIWPRNNHNRKGK